MKGKGRKGNGKGYEERECRAGEGTEGERSVGDGLEEFGTGGE